MLLLVGLGNPGSDYTNTRHNIGFKIIDAINLHFKLSKQKPKFKGLLTTGNIEEKKINAIKPLTFMNNSGTAIKELIDQLEMNDWIDRKCGTYSGGMKRRIDLAAGLLHLPKVLILDEPTVGLDIESRNIIWLLLKDLRNSGMTIILSSHYLDEIDKLADRLVIIDDGRVIAQGAPAELKNKLGGDRVTLKVREFSNQEEAKNICKILSSIDGISQIIINEAQGFSINFVADKEKDLLTKLKVELAFSKFEIFSLTQSQPSLDDVYLQATGKTLLDAEISMAGKRDLKKESKQSMR